ncbi:hypothetical protein HDU93_001728, partial [Gonapodya sp. JEL0774]
IESEFMTNFNTGKALLVLAWSALNRDEQVADDRERIKKMYRRNYGRTLASRVRTVTEKDHRLALLAVLDEPLEGF